uniref:Transmembrane protein 214 n=1 Tax=Gouania willdenowi TaxID=441366 RepID=A0A8C5I7U8_GOUWI
MNRCSQFILSVFCCEHCMNHEYNTRLCYVSSEGGGSSSKTLSVNVLLCFPAAPLKMSETLFEGFEKMTKKQNKEQVPPAAESSNKKASSSKPSKKSHSSNNTPSPPPPRKTLEEAFKSLDISDLKQQLARSQSLFPENPSVWVKDLAGYLNLHLTAPETEPTLSSYAHDYPYCLTGKELKGVIKGLIGRCSNVLPDFFDYCIYTMLRELDRQSGEPLHGYRVCIQAILQDKSRIATQNLPEYLELLRSVQNRPVKCLTIMWALGQAGFYDLSQGLKVWLGIMLPVLGVKSLSSYAIAYLERLLLLHANLTKGFGIMGPKEFFPLLDFAFMPKNALSPSLQEQLRRLYPRLKVLAFGAKPENTLHTYLPSFLSRATPNCPDDMKRENHTHNVLSGLLMLLLVFLLSLLLDHLLKSWSVLPPKLRKNLKETIQSFRVTNEEMGDAVGSQDLQECAALCQNLQVKMRGRGFPWSKLLLVLLVFIAGFVAHDLRSHGSVAGRACSVSNLLFSNFTDFYCCFVYFYFILCVFCSNIYFSHFVLIFGCLVVCFVRNLVHFCCLRFWSHFYSIFVVVLDIFLSFCVFMLLF